MRNSIHLAIMLIAMAIIASSCSEKATTAPGNTIHYTRFPQETELTGKSYTVDEAMLNYPFRIRVLGEYIYVMDLHATDNIMHIFNKTTMHHLHSFATRGNGPNEMIQAKNFYCHSHDSIWIYDMAKREVSRWSHDLGNDTITCAENIKLDKTIVSPFDFTLCSDTSFIFTDDSGVHRYIEVDMQGNPIRAFGSIPLSEQARTNNPALLAQGWVSYLHYSPRHNILVSATQLGDVLEVCNRNTDSTTVAYGKTADPKFSPQGDYSIPIGLMGFGDVQITSNNIYTIFYGRAFRDIVRSGAQTPDGGKYINVFDLNGNPVKQYILDREITGFYIDEAAHTLWGTDINNEEQIVLYHLN